MTTESQKLYMDAAEVFRPSAPIDHRDLFAGRIDQLSSLLDSLGTRGQHAVVYGERGVGKTSLVTILGSMTWTRPRVVVRLNCHADATFPRLWTSALDGVRFEVEKRRVGFNAESHRQVVSLADQAPDPAPDQVVRALRAVEADLVFVFDEFDQIHNKAVSNAFAEVMKALSDFATASKIVLVGVGDTVDALIASHASVERAVRQIRMPRMRPDESAEIIAKADERLGVKFMPSARDRVVRLAHGLPHYVHLLGLHSVRAAIIGGAKTVSMDAVQQGIRKAIDDASQSLLDMYMKATTSPQTDSLYRQVLLACALAKTDDLSSFAPAGVRAPLQKMGRKLEIPAFAAHLNKFAGADRGGVLKKFGTSRRYRYRFSNPLLQPFVVMRGIADGLIKADVAEQLLAS